MEKHKILSPTAEGFRKGRSGPRASLLLQLILEHAHRFGRDIFVHYIDFKGAFPSQDHLLLTRILTFLGLPDDFTRLIGNLYTTATTTFLTPHCPTAPIPIGRGTLQGDPLSPLLFALAVEPLIRWIEHDGLGYQLTPLDNIASLWYADDATLITTTQEDMATLNLRNDRFSDWSGILTNISKCRTTAYIHALQPLPPMARDDALTTRLSTLTLKGSPIPTLSQDEPLPSAT